MLRVLNMYTRGMTLGKNATERLPKFCNERELGMAYTWFYKTDKRKITYSASGCETEIDFVLVEEKIKKYLRQVKVIQWEL